MCRKWTARFMSAMLGAALLLGTAMPVLAFDSPKDCAKRVRHAEKNLYDAERKHGRHSRQAAERRREVERARAKCSM